MLLRERRRPIRLLLAVGAAISLLLLCGRLTDPAATETLLGYGFVRIHGKVSPYSSSSLSPTLQRPFYDGPGAAPPAAGSPSKFIEPSGAITGFWPPSSRSPGLGNLPLHTEIFSITTKDRKFFPIKFGSAIALNPSILPHPREDNKWIIIAQRREDDGTSPPTPAIPPPSVEIVCTAVFIDDTLTCIGEDGRGFGEPQVLPIEPTVTRDPAQCSGDMEFFPLNVGPHDARVFYGPDAPYTLYGSNSHFTCFGQWLQDLRALLPDWTGLEEHTRVPLDKTLHPPRTEFTKGTELQRSQKALFRPVEKNWFLFWASDGSRWVHYDMTPFRAFAPLLSDGSAGDTLMLGSAAQDNECLARLLPAMNAPESESLHQATNSLEVTLCRRADPSCEPSDENTFIIAVIQHKTFYNFHATYHPYVVVFRRAAPFAVWAVSGQPMWISGREAMADRVDTQMFYVTSMSWKARGQRYHGYVDDVLFLAFGIEDRAAGGLDLLAGDLLANLKTCSGDG